MRIALAVLLAALTAALYALATSLQTLEARQVPREAALRATLLGRLVRRPLWLAGTVAGAIGWPMQAGALALGSIAVVQPALGLGLVVLLVLGGRVLHEPIGRRELGGTAAVVAGVAVLAWAGPTATGSFTGRGEWAVGLALAAVAPAPYLLRLARRGGGLATSVAAGLAWGWTGLGTALVDAAVSHRHWLVALGWGAGVGAATWGGLLVEMTALQQWPATRAVPVAFCLEMAAPAVVAPLLTSATLPHAVGFGLGLGVACAGAVLLGTSRAVARAVSAEAAL